MGKLGIFWFSALVQRFVAGRKKVPQQLKFVDRARNASPSAAISRAGALINY
jgi:hypothetical protein